MERDYVLKVNDAVHKMQLSLLEGIKHENQLYAAGSLMSQSDYQDVVTERTIANMCGYPLCGNSLPSERPWKGHYRISLKEHKVYDLHETYMYCSSSCLINSRTFAGSLPAERSWNLNPAKLNEVLKLFYELDLGPSVNKRDIGDLGLSELKIQEKSDTEHEKVSFEEWIGPSNAIDGYVPRRDRNLKTESNNLQKDVRPEQFESGPSHAQGNVADIISDDVNFTSVIITQDEYSISKTVDPMEAKESKAKVRKSRTSHAQGNVADIISDDVNFTSVIITQDEYNMSKTVDPRKAEESKGKVRSKDVNDLGNYRQNLDAPLQKIRETRSKPLDKDKNVIAENDKLNISEDPHGPGQNDLIKVAKVADDELCLQKKSPCGATVLKSSLKTSDSKKGSRSVTWADENTDGDAQNLCEFSESEDNNGGAVRSHSSAYKVGEEDSDRYTSAEACASALSQAAEAVASGHSDVSDAVSEAGVVILPPPHGVDEVKCQEIDGVNLDPETDPVLLKWPPKPGFSEADLFDSEDSWYDNPPEGFNLTLSPFSTMFMALFSWISSSSLAYIYGREDSFHEEYLYVNGREYPRKVVTPDGRSSEIKQTLAGCLARALPGLVAELRLPIPISTLEQAMALLLDTMSFIDPLPAFRMKQWQAIVLLFLDALSVSRIPALTKYMDRRILLPKVLEGAQMSAEEFEILKDLIIPLGRVPQFSSQSGG